MSLLRLQRRLTRRIFSSNSNSSRGEQEGGQQGRVLRVLGEGSRVVALIWLMGNSRGEGRTIALASLAGRDDDAVEAEKPRALYHATLRHALLTP